MEKKDTFANRLKQALDENDWSQTELAKRAKVSKSSITRYLKGDWEAKQDVIYSIAEVTGLNEAWLMGYDVPKKKAPATDGERNVDPDIRRIERARKNMTEKDKKKMMELLELSFEDYFSDDYKDSDLDE